MSYRRDRSILQALILLLALFAGALIAWPVLSGAGDAVQFRTAVSDSGQHGGNLELLVAMRPPIA